MNLWLSSCFLVAGLFLSSSALTHEECQPLIKPLTMTPSMIYGKSHFLYGYNDNEAYNEFMKNIQSYSNSVVQSSFGPNVLNVSTENKLNGTCLSLNLKATIENNALIMRFDNFVSLNHLLPSCDGCLLYSFNRTAADLDKMYKKMRLKGDITADRIIMRGLYLFVRGTTVTESDLQHFKKQAHCLGFTGEPNFVWDPKNDFCPAEKGLRMIDDKGHSLPGKHHSVDDAHPSLDVEGDSGSEESRSLENERDSGSEEAGSHRRH